MQVDISNANATQPGEVPKCSGVFSVCCSEEGIGTVSGVLYSRHYFWLNIKWILCKQVITKRRRQSGESTERKEWGKGS